METTDANTLPKVSYTDFFSTTIPTELLTLPPLSNLPTVTQHPIGFDPKISCYNYTLVQGPATNEFHLTIPEASITNDYNCDWQGEMTTADITCTVTMKGGTHVVGSNGVQTTVLADTMIEESSLIGQMVVVTVEGNGSATDTPSAPTSTGLAATRPLPTGFGMAAWAGGSAAVLVAAVVL